MTEQGTDRYGAEYKLPEPYAKPSHNYCKHRGFNQYCGIDFDRRGSRAKRTDCFYYSEHQEMGAHISCCGKHIGLDNCPCDTCNDFLSKQEASKIIAKAIENGENDG